jgi:hypothetical protein
MNMLRHQLFIRFLVFLLLGSGTAACLRKSEEAEPSTQVASEAKWEPIFFKMINERLAESGIPELRTSQMTGADFEGRVWIGFGGRGEDAIILRHSSSQWSGLHLHGISRGPRLVSTVSNLAAPRSGWEAAWQKLTQAGLLTLPDALAIGCSTQIFDGMSYVVEINKDQNYRTYLYDNPDHAKCSEAKQMLEIGGIIAEEFDLSEFKTGG